MTDYPYSRRMVDMTDWANVIAPPRELRMTESCNWMRPTVALELSAPDLAHTVIGPPFVEPVVPV